jgi:hypothetical protein
MSGPMSDADLLREARAIARRKGMFVVLRHDKGGQIEAYLLYRQIPHQTRGQFIGKRQSIRAFHHLVTDAAAAAPANPHRS